MVLVVVVLVAALVEEEEAVAVDRPAARAVALLTSACTEAPLSAVCLKVITTTVTLSIVFSVCVVVGERGGRRSDVEGQQRAAMLWRMPHIMAVKGQVGESLSRVLASLLGISSNRDCCLCIHDIPQAVRSQD